MKGVRDLLISGVFLAASCNPALANDVTVGCEGASGHYKYSSISAALADLHAISYRDHTITVSGTCAEAVRIHDFENLDLTGTAGAAIVDATGTGSVLYITASKSISIRGLALRGSGPRRARVVTIVDSTVIFNDCTIENGVVGAFIAGLSHVRFFSSVIQNNEWQGIRADDNSWLEVEDVSIQGNRHGIRVNRSRATILGAFISQNNTYDGILVQQGALLFYSGEDLPEQKILANGRDGIRVETGGKLEMCGPALIEGNPRAGIELIDSSAKFFCTSQTIRGNGTAGNPLTGGIIALGNSHADLYHAEVVENSGSGLVVRENSSARIVSNTTFTGNGGDGVRVASLSTATLYGPNTITGNSGFDLFCTPDAFASGDSTGVGRMRCAKFEPSSEPAPDSM